MLKKGLLYINDHGKYIPEEYYMSLLSIKNIDEMISLQNTVINQLENKEIFFPDTYYTLYDSIMNGAIVLGVYNINNQLICYRWVKSPKMNKDNLGYDLNLPSESLNYVMHLESTVVDPKYRGNNLQYLTLDVLLPVIKDMGAEHLACTVSPFNVHSLNNIMKHGLKVKVLKRKYDTKENDGLWRYILHKTIEDKNYGRIIDIIISDIEDIHKQTNLLSQGYIGFELIKKDKKIKYIKFE